MGAIVALLQQALAEHCFKELRELFYQNNYYILNGDYLALELKPMSGEGVTNISINISNYIGSYQPLDFVDPYKKAVARRFELTNCTHITNTSDPYKLAALCADNRLFVLDIDPIEGMITSSTSLEVASPISHVCKTMATSAYIPGAIYVYCRPIESFGFRTSILLTTDLALTKVSSVILIDELTWDMKVGFSFVPYDDLVYIILHRPGGYFESKESEENASIWVVQYRKSTESYTDRRVYNLENGKISGMRWIDTSLAKILAVFTYSDNVILATCNDKSCIFQYCDFIDDNILVTLNCQEVIAWEYRVPFFDRNTYLFYAEVPSHPLGEMTSTPTMFCLMDGYKLYMSKSTGFADFDIDQPLLSLLKRFTEVNTIQFGLDNELILIGRNSPLPENRSLYVRRDEMLMILSPGADPKYHFPEDGPDISDTDPNDSQLLHLYYLNSPISQDYLFELVPGNLKLMEIGEMVFAWNTTYKPRKNKNDTSKVTLTCTLTNETQENFSIDMVVMAEVNSYASLDLFELQKYVQTPRIALTTRFDTVYGNAPKFTLTNSSDKFKLRTYLIDKLQVKWTNHYKSMTNVRGIGDNLVAMWNDSDFILLRCQYTEATIDLNCSNDGLIKMSLKNTIIMDLLLVNNLVVFAFKTINPPQVAETLKITIIHINGTVYEKLGQVYTLSPKYVKMQRNSVYVLLHAVGTQDVTNSPLRMTESLFYMQFNPMTDFMLPTSLVKNMDFPDFLCPRAIVPDYKSRFILYITCRCENSSQTTVVSFNFNVNNIAGSQTGVTVFLPSTKDKIICASSQNLFVVNAGALDLFIVPLAFEAARLSKVRLPLVDYGVTAILDIFCETRRRTMQVLGKTYDGEKILITYRTEGFSDATKRVHSVVTVHPDATEILKVTNMGEDLLFTIILDIESKPLEAFVVETNGPFLYLDATDQTAEEKVELMVRCDLMKAGNQTKSIDSQQNISFIQNKEFLQISADPSLDKIKVMNDITISLDQILKVSGYYESIHSSENVSYVVQDRFPLQSVHNLLGDISLNDSCSIDNFIFAYNDSGHEVLVQLKNANDNTTLNEFKVKSVIQIACLQHPTHNQHLFVALTLNNSGLNWINVVSWQRSADCPKTSEIRVWEASSRYNQCTPKWKQNGLNLFTDGYTKASINMTASGDIMLAASSFKYGFMYMARMLYLDKGQLMSSSECVVNTKEIITSLKVLAILDTMAVTYTELNNMTLKFDYYRKGENHLLEFYESHAVQPVDQFKALMVNNVYDCQTVTNNSMVYLLCVMLDYDTIAFVFTVKLVFREQPPIVRLTLPMKIVHYLEPLPYAYPKKVEIYGEYISVYSRTGPYATGQDKMVGIIYRIPSECYFSNGTKSVSPYKVFSSKTIGTNQGLDDLDANFYRTRDGSLMYYLKSGNYQRMLFKVGGLSLKINDMNGIMNDSELVFYYPDRCFGTCSFNKNTKNVTLVLSSVIEICHCDDQGDFFKRKKVMLLVLAVCGLALMIAFLTFLVFCPEKKSVFKMDDIFLEVSPDSPGLHATSLLEVNSKETFTTSGSLRLDLTPK